MLSHSCWHRGNPPESDGIKGRAEHSKKLQAIRERLINTKPEHSGAHPVTHFSSMEARFDHVNSATKGRNSKKEKKESSLKRLGVILCIGALVVCLVGGGIYFGPVIARGSKMTQAKKLQREVYGEGIKLMKLAAAGKVESNQFRQTLERGEALEKRLELLKRDFTPEQMSIFEEWLLDFALEEESKLKKRW